MWNRVMTWAYMFKSRVVAQGSGDSVYPQLPHCHYSWLAKLFTTKHVVSHNSNTPPHLATKLITAQQITPQPEQSVGNLFRYDKYLRMRIGKSETWNLFSVFVSEQCWIQTEKYCVCMHVCCLGHLRVRTFHSTTLCLKIKWCFITQ